MTEVRFPKPSVLVKFKLETDLIDPPELTLELTPASKKERFSVLMGIGEHFKPDTAPEDIMPAVDRLIPVAMRHVTSWDLTLNGAPIPCTDEEKAKWLEPLLWEDAELIQEDPVEAGNQADKTAAEGRGPWLWAKITAFISEKRNFLKN